VTSPLRNIRVLSICTLAAGAVALIGMPPAGAALAASAAAARTAASSTTAAAATAATRQAATVAAHAHGGKPASVKLRLASAPSAAAAARHIGQAGLISGIVVGPAAIPLGGICVAAQRAGSGLGSVRLARTSGDGRYLIADLSPGEYSVSFSDCSNPDGYLGQAYSAVTGQNRGHIAVLTGRPTVLPPVTLLPASPQVAMATERAYLAAHPAAAAGGHPKTGPFLSGIVRSRSGKPLAGICVQAWASQTFPGGESIWYLYTQTDRAGRYSYPRIFAFPARNYRVLFTIGCGNSANYAPQWWNHSATGRRATLLVVKKGTTLKHIDATLTEGATVTGTVRALTKNGAGVKGICVLGSGRGAMSGAVVMSATGAGGHYVLHGLGTGRFFIHFSPYCGTTGNYLSAAARVVQVTDGKTVSGVNGVLILGGQISGSASSAATGQGLPGICIFFEGNTANFGFLTESVTGRLGRYAFRHLQPGSYAIAFAGGCGNSGSYAPQTYDGPDSSNGIITITLGRVDKGVDAAMLPGATIAGKVTSQASGKAVPSACVVLASQQAAGALGGNLNVFSGYEQPTALAFAGSNGSYQIPDLAPGLYITEFTTCTFGTSSYAPAWYSPEGDGAPDWVSASAGRVTSGVSGTLAVGGSISGTITSAAGRPLSAICALAQSPSDPYTAINNVLGGGPVQSNRKGEYKITGLPAGSYSVEFGPCNFQPYALQWYKGAGTQAAATPVTVSLGHDTPGIDARLVRGGTVSGQIISAITSLPVSYACVAVLDSSQQNVIAVNFTGPAGTFSIPNLPQGTFDIEPADCQNPASLLAAVVRSGVQIKNGHTTGGVVIALPRAGTISGLITTDVPSLSVEGTCIDAIPVSGNGQLEVTVPQSDGSYVLPGLAAGSYQLLFTNACIFGTAGLAPQQATASVTVGGSTTVNAALVADGGISGIVTSSATTAGVGGICVGAYPNAAATSPSAVAVTGSDGTYQIGYLTPGSYVVKFSVGCGGTGYATQWWNDASSAATAAPVNVTPGSSVTGINAALST